MPWKVLFLKEISLKFGKIWSKKKNDLNLLIVELKLIMDNFRNKFRNKKK